MQRATQISTFKNDELFAVGGLLLGRVTYQGFTAAWPSRSGDYADRISSLPKFVVSTTLQDLEWNNSKRIQSDVATEVSKLKQHFDQDLLIFGSMMLVNTLLQNDLVDEYRLLVYPVVLGTGKRLFSEGSTAKLTLTKVQDIGSGVVLTTYAPSW